MRGERGQPSWLNYEHLADAIPGGVLAFDNEGRTIYATDRAASLFGTEPSELIGRSLEQLTTSEWADVARMHMRQVAKGERATFDFFFLSAAGTETWARVSMAPAFEDGAVVGVVAVLFDISGERLVEVKLREAELRLREAAAHMPGVIYEVRVVSDGRLLIEYVSEAVKDYLGIDADTLILSHQDAVPYLHPDDLELVRSKVAEATQTLQPMALEFRLVGPKQIHHLYAASSVALSEDGSVLISGVAIDIGDLKRTETMLRASQAQLNAVFDNFPFECWTLDLQGCYVLQNPASRARWGMQAGKTISALSLPREVLEDWQADIDKAIAGEIARRDLVIHMEGRRNHFARSLVPIRDGEVLLGVLGVTVDTTEQRRLEEQLAHSQRLDAIGRLAGGIAHDFNNVLTAIMSCVRLLERRLDGPPRRELQIIRDGAQRAAELTRQLLAFARQEMVEPRHAMVDEIVLKSDRLLRRLIGEDIELVTLANTEGWEVVVDPVRLEQAIINLVVNSRDAMPRGGRITVRSRCVDQKQSIASVDGAIPVGEYAVITVEDSGHGMTSEAMSRAFEPFFTTRHESGGTGLGLSSVYGFVHQAQGYVTLDSGVDEGTTIGLYLPRAFRDETETEQEATEFPASPGGTETILLVEDEPLVMSVACQSLRMSGYTVLQARSPKIAMEVSRAHEGHIDLLLTDVIMPEGGGTELAETIRAERPSIAVLFMSGYASERLSIEEGKVFFLPKPFTPERLDFQVREVLDSTLPKD